MHRRWFKWLIGSLVVLALLAGGGYLWLRNSSLVAVRKVQVAGVSGPNARQIRGALIEAARTMTTLDVNVGQLRTAVEPYPDVKHLEVSTQFPHGMTIRVVEQVPVAVLIEAGRRVGVAGDGTLLRDASLTSTLPTIPVQVPPGGPRLTGYLLTEVQLLAAAPYDMLAKVGGVSDGPAHGLVAELRNGPSIYFGDPNQLAAKWTAAIVVLANSGSASADYIDVTDPNRPAAGAGSDSNASAAGSAAEPGRIRTLRPPCRRISGHEQLDGDRIGEREQLDRDRLWRLNLNLRLIATRAPVSCRCREFLLLQRTLRRSPPR